jgi:sugar/nucleoside kinase (ribokinase family)
VIVGSIGLDTIKTPAGQVVDAPGGSAVYGSISGSYFTDVHIIGVVGEDYPQEARQMLHRHGVNLEGLEVAAGKTFRWSGLYQDWNKAQTLNTELNVFADFVPRIPQACSSCHSLLLANIHPELQLQVLQKTASYTHVACDTMNFWIKGCPHTLREVISRVQIVFMNEDEIKEFTGKMDIFSAAESILELGPQLMVVKRGEYGSIAISREEMFFAPAYPIRQVKDPTGAGDSFAGAFMAHLEGASDLNFSKVKDAVRYGTIMAAYNVSQFSVDGMLDLNRDRIDQDKEALCKMTN